MKPGSLLAALAVHLAGSAAASQVPLADAVQLSARGDHACVVTTSGAALCWGSNSSGQLGGGPLTDRSRLAASDVVGLSSGVASVAAAEGPHSCAVLSTGAVKCWGSNSSGQLGDGTTTDRAVPVDVLGLPGPAIAVSGGGAHTCAILADHTVACWGSNASGQLGDGTTTDRLAPTIVPGLSGVVAISASLSHTCAIASGGAAKCWGDNSRGELGDGTTTSSSSPVDVSGLATGVTSIDTAGDPGAPGPGYAAPEAYTCATVTDGTVMCWGSASGSSLPTGVTGIGASAAAVTVGATRYFPGVLMSSFPISHYCAVTAVGGAKCWGDDHCGMVGRGGPDTCTTLVFDGSPPVDVVGLTSGVVSIGAQNWSTCALLSGGGVDCWGMGYGTVPVTEMQGASPQSLLFYAAPSLAVGAAGTLTVLGGDSGNAVTFTSATPATCSVGAATLSVTDGLPMYSATVTALAGGTCTIAADQAGSLYYDPAPEATSSFSIDPRLAQQITFSAVSGVFAGGVAILNATSSSGLPVSLSLVYPSGEPCSISGDFLIAAAYASAPSTCDVQASQPGNSTYAPAADVQQAIPVLANAGTSIVALYPFGGGDGSVTSSPSGIDCGPTCAGNFANGSAVTLTAVAAAGSAFEGWSGACSGTGPCTVSMDAEKDVGVRFASDTPRLANLSTRGHVGTGNDVLIGGFVIGGSGPKTVIVRARGPSLLPYGVTDAIGDPFVLLVRSSDQSTLATNDSLQSSPDRAAITAMGFGLDYPLEAAILATLDPGAYTAIVTPGILAPGVGMFEVFEVDDAQQPLVNVSTRGDVLGGNDVLIAGFVVQGTGPQTVVVRGRGPSLAAFGVANALPNPQIQVVRSSDQAVLASNDDWAAGADAAAISSAGFAPSDPRESAVLLTLPPGAYTAILSGAGGTTGTGIVEVFRVGN